MTLRACLFCFLATACASVGHADIVTLTPSDINGGDTTTASFADSFLTLTPMQGANAATFNADATRLGIDDFGTNANAFNDPDTDANNGNEEALDFSFVAGSGLAGISYDFSRADGPGAQDGVIISGFLQDPNVTFSVSDANLFAVYDGAGTVRLNIPGTLFNGTDVAIGFDAAASDGQDLLLSVTDTTQAGAQFAILSISYDDDIVAVPEPSTALGLLAIGFVGIARRRKKLA